MHHPMLKICTLLMSLQAMIAQPLRLTPHERHMIEQFTSYSSTPHYFEQWLSLEPLAEESIQKEAPYQEYRGQNPLFKNYKGLEKNLSYVQLGDYPTPLLSCNALSSRYQNTRLYLKQDGLTGMMQHRGRDFGGNKLRKLEYLLADACAHGYTSVLTFGCAGSNHALQTAWCARSLGLQAISMLAPQPNSQVVRKNLLLQQYVGADIYYAANRQHVGFLTPAVCSIYKQRYGSVPYIIPTGGSCPRGAIGYVQAAFELKDQIDAGLMPIPDRIYVALGSGGTVAGLLLGLKAVGLNVRLICTLDEPESEPGRMREKVRRLFVQTNDLLLSYDQSFQRFELRDSDFEIHDETSGTEYGLFTPEVMKAIAYMKETEGINLEGTYTAKCFALLVRHLEKGDCKDKTVLFWNTYCGERFDDISRTVPYRSLPRALHYYFETEVQPLDQ